MVLLTAKCVSICVCMSGVCHSVPVSEIIAVREEEEENRGDGSWKKIKEREGKDCGQAFTGNEVEQAEFDLVNRNWTH